MYILVFDQIIPLEHRSTWTRHYCFFFATLLLDLLGSFLLILLLPHWSLFYLTKKLRCSFDGSLPRSRLGASLCFCPFLSKSEGQWISYIGLGIQLKAIATLRTDLGKTLIALTGLVFWWIRSSLQVYYTLHLVVLWPPYSLCCWIARTSLCGFLPVDYHLESHR